MDQNEMRRRLGEIADEQERKKKPGTSIKASDGANVVVKLLALVLQLIVRFFAFALGLLLAICKLCFGFFFR